jgi:hypothetical protein
VVALSGARTGETAIADRRVVGQNAIPPSIGIDKLPAPVT